MHEKQCQGEITLHLFKRRQTVIFHRGVQQFKVFLRQETSAKKNVLHQVCASTGSLVEHWVSDWMITCYCLIVIRIVKVINWL